MTPDEIKAAITKEVAEALRPVTTQVGTIVESIKGLPDLSKQIASLVEKDSAATIAGKDGAKKEDKGKTDPAAATALTPEAVSKLVSEGIAAALKERDTTAATTAQQQADLTTFIEKNAPKLKGNPLAKRLFSAAKNDDERKAILAEYVESVKATGAKPPDLGATAAGEGGTTTTADTAEAKKAQAMEAAKSLKPVTL